ncbi:MAG: DUF1501 domain-containing protein [Prosthecobacter sp.]|jgi:hypothetical protein|uniref:DUF1501 domain-containing protein n=1 Tax=Prosthecobacter sp. TaxID=1965333 RepID=UPI0019E97F63|nr:DUF1501 domain-containing protein [Prosthecobacter sp.]MBE2283231.1 DUF1501 domain-containing protein [Prosthecobacter sp.]
MNISPCQSHSHLSRRSVLRGTGIAGLSWLTPLADLLAVEAEKAPSGKPARSVILLWLGGAASQLDTFDPHPTTKIGGGVKTIPTAIKGVEFASGLEQTASVMKDVSLIRSMVSKEGDHERAFYNIKTGYRPDPTLIHPSIGAIVCHELPEAKIEIPTHVSILPNQWPARGGFFGAQFDAFQMYDPKQQVPDVKARVDEKRMDRRLEGLSVVENVFAQGRSPNLDEEKTLHQISMQRARKMMTSDQLKAFNVSDVPAKELAAYGDTPFGRGCLAAVRLIQAGVRCVEVTLSGWDTHANNLEGQASQVKILDAAYASLIRDLKKLGLLESTIVLCGGEFGRTPKINNVGGRDHWPHGFSMLVAGGGFAGGRVIGATDPEGERKEPENPVFVEDLHATVQSLFGIDYSKEIMTPIGRPMVLSKGDVVEALKA